MTSTTRKAPRDTWLIVLCHPAIGLLTFTDYNAAADTADDIGEQYDLNEVGTLKSRAFLCHNLD